AMLIEQGVWAAVRTRSVTCSPRSVVSGPLTNTTGIGVGVGDGVGVVGTGVCGYTVGAGARPWACGCFGPAVFPPVGEGGPWVAGPIIAPRMTIAAAATAAASRSLPLKRGSRMPSRDDIHDPRRFRARPRPLELGSALRE